MHWQIFMLTATLECSSKKRGWIEKNPVFNQYYKGIMNSNAALIKPQTESVTQNYLR